jgi:hypothetical protein
MQEINGICNVYWYVGHYSKYRFEQQNQLMKPIEINSIRNSNSSNKIKTIHLNENLSNLVTKPTTNDLSKIGFDVSLLNQNENNIESSNNYNKSNIKQDRFVDNRKSIEIENNKNCSTSNISNCETFNLNKEIKKQSQDVGTSVSDINKKSSFFNTNESISDQKNKHVLHKNFYKIPPSASSINDSPSIKFIIDERLTAPLSLNILPASYSNKLKTSLLNPTNVILNEEDFNTTTSISFPSSSQSSTPQFCSATSTSQEDEESTPNLTITSSTSSSSTDSTLSPVNEVSPISNTDFNTSKNNPEIMFINNMMPPFTGHFNQYDLFKTNQNHNIISSSNYLRKNPIDLENDQDDLKAKFYKLPLKSNKDSTLNNNTLLNESSQNQINNFRLINTINSNYSKSFDDHYNNYIANNDNYNNINNIKKQNIYKGKNISSTFSNDFIAYLCDKSLSENNNNNSNNSYKIALKKHEQNQIYQGYLFEKYLKRQQKKENELEHLKSLLIKNSNNINKFSSNLSQIIPPPPTSASNSTLQNSPSNTITKNVFSNDPNINQNQNNIPVLFKRQHIRHFQNPTKLNMNDAMVHNNNYKSNSLRLDTNVNSIINTANQYQSKLFDNNNDINNTDTCFNNNLYFLNCNSNIRNSPSLVGNNLFNNNNNNNNNNSNTRQKNATIGSEEMIKYRNESNVSRLLRNKNKYRPKYQRNKSSDYQPVTRYIIDDNNYNSNEKFNNKYNFEDDELGDSKKAFNANTMKRLLSGDADITSLNKEINDQNDIFMTINSSRSGFGISNETNAQRLRRNFKRTTSV